MENNSSKEFNKGSSVAITIDKETAAAHNERAGLIWETMALQSGAQGTHSEYEATLVPIYD